MGYSIYSDAKAAKAKKSRIGNILMKMSRRAYAEMFGPTVGDRVRLADTELFIQVEQDLTTYGEEVKIWRWQGHSRWYGTVTIIV